MHPSLRQAFFARFECTRFFGPAILRHVIHLAALEALALELLLVAFALLSPCFAFFSCALSRPFFFVCSHVLMDAGD